jgi:hypothetical protein
MYYGYASESEHHRPELRSSEFATSDDRFLREHLSRVTPPSVEEVRLNGTLYALIVRHGFDRPGARDRASRSERCQVSLGLEEKI